ncbi:MAG: TIGR00725 family protein [Thermodesulfobacteriota bacterium]
MTVKRYIIGVIGSGAEDPELNGMAEEVGALIGEGNHILVSGGLGGVMEASARGAKLKGGLTVGILPGKDPGAANPHIDIRLPTGLGEGRNLLIIRASAALIALGGGYGTLSEIAFALKLKKPVVGLNTWDVSDDIIPASTPGEALEKVLAVLNEGNCAGKSFSGSKRR